MFGVISASYTDLGGRRRAGADHRRPGQRPPEAAGGRVRPRPVRHQHATTNDVGGGGQHRGSLSNGDWIALNGPFNLLNIDSLTFRGDTSHAGAGRHPWRPSRCTSTPSTGRSSPPSRSSATGDAHLLAEPDRPDHRSGRPAQGLPGVPTIAGGQTGNNFFNLNWVEFGGVGNRRSVARTTTGPIEEFAAEGNGCRLLDRQERTDGVHQGPEPATLLGGCRCGGARRPRRSARHRRSRTGGAGAAGDGLIPHGKMGTITFTQRDVPSRIGIAASAALGVRRRWASSAGPTSRRTRPTSGRWCRCRAGGASCSSSWPNAGFKQIEFAGYGQNANNPGGGAPNPARAA